MLWCVWCRVSCPLKSRCWSHTNIDVSSTRGSADNQSYAADKPGMIYITSWSLVPFGKIINPSPRPLQVSRGFSNMAAASYDQLLRQVEVLKMENSNLRQELQDNSNHLTKLETEASNMKVSTGEVTWSTSKYSAVKSHMIICRLTNHEAGVQHDDQVRWSGDLINQLIDHLSVSICISSISLSLFSIM